MEDRRKEKLEAEDTVGMESSGTSCEPTLEAFVALKKNLSGSIEIASTFNNAIERKIPETNSKAIQQMCAQFIIQLIILGTPLITASLSVPLSRTLSNATFANAIQNINSP